MYFPYLRGKQFELLALRESAPVIASAGFVPILEPVRESLTGLRRALEELQKAAAKAILIANPVYGDLRSDASGVHALLDELSDACSSIAPGILLTNDMSISDVKAVNDSLPDTPKALIHAGFRDPKGLARLIAEDLAVTQNIFIDSHANLLYRRHFTSSPKCLVRDGFIKVRNADYPPVDLFSDLHITYPDRGLDGYGDYLTIGDTYSEGGGPAYAVAIHLSFIDPSQDDQMFVHHFKSTTNDTPADPAGKFAQALDSLISTLQSGKSHLLETSAVREFRQLHERGHFPGLGHIKKLSINHHIETLAEYHAGEG